jgi:hypothetical protein
MAIAKKVKKTKKAAPTEKAASTTTGETGTYTGYCVKCKEKGVEYQGAVSLTSAGTRMAKGPCPTCGTTICRILGKDK